MVRRISRLTIAVVTVRSTGPASVPRPRIQPEGLVHARFDVKYPAPTHPQLLRSLVRASRRSSP
jgi:hypothetical protein